MNTRGKPFPKGNPGRPIGARHKTTITVERLLEGEADAIGRKCIEMALGGDTTALRLAMERIAPVRRARVQFSFAAGRGGDDLPKAVATVLAAMAEGTLSPGEGSAMRSRCNVGC